MEQTIQNVELKLLTFKDYSELKTVMINSYHTMPESFWEKSEIKSLIKVFPDGQIIITVNGQIAGCALSIIVDYKKFEGRHTYKQVTGNYTFNTHDNDGDTLYGLDVFVKPEFRGLRLGRRLYEYRKQLCERLNLQGIIFGGRIPNYHQYAGEITPKEYIEKVRSKEIDDPVLNFQLSNEFYPVKIMKGYLDGDKASGEYAVLLKWHNVYYESPDLKGNFVKKVVRLGLVQWQMRPYGDLKTLMQQVEFFVDSLSAYKSDFALFPEFFNAPLMTAYNHLSESEAIRKLAENTQELVQEFSKLAVSYNINIITGSMPEVVDNVLYNTGYLCRRDGSVDSFEKLHITPDEEKFWGIKGGDKLQTYDTDCGKIGVLICYDVEFPELSRLLADEGMKILFAIFNGHPKRLFACTVLCSIQGHRK